MFTGLHNLFHLSDPLYTYVIYEGGEFDLWNNLLIFIHFIITFFLSQLFISFSFFAGSRCFDWFRNMLLNTMSFD